MLIELQHNQNGYGFILVLPQETVTIAGVTIQVMLYDNDASIARMASYLGFVACGCGAVGPQDCDHKTGDQLVVDAMVWLDENVGHVFNTQKI